MDKPRNNPQKRMNREAIDVELPLTPGTLREFEDSHWTFAQSHSNKDRVRKHGEDDADVEEDNEDEVDGVEQTNAFATKKSLAQGMMDVALLTANANQMRYIIEFNRRSRTFYFLFFMIILSMLLQVIVGISLILMDKTSVNEEVTYQKTAQKVAKRNKLVLIGVFVITVINVIIATFPINDHSSVNSPLSTTTSAS